MMPGPLQVRELNLANGGTEQAHVWGPGVKLPVAYAAQCNASAGHALDFDDVHDLVMHPGVVSVSTSLALADYKGGMTGKELMLNVALGAEMLLRMNRGSEPGTPIPEQGWHTTTLNGNIVAANLAARTLGLTFEESLNAIGLGLHQASGTGQVVKDGGCAKRIGPGFAVRNGIISAQLAQRGVTAGIHALEGVEGYFKQYHRNNYDRNLVLEGLGDYWFASGVLCKPYPCCRGTHNFIDCGIYLHDHYDIKPEEIERIDIKCGKGTLNLLGLPLEVKAHPKTPVDVQFSASWGAVCGLVYGRATLAEYSDSEAGIWNPVLREVADKVKTLEYSPKCDPRDIKKSPYEGAIVTVTMKNGEVYEKYYPEAMGSEEMPQSYEDVIKKFQGNIDYAAKKPSAESIKKMVDICSELDKCEDVRILNDLMVWG
jgi:2-methylcitrate dehydratase PrpD